MNVRLENGVHGTSSVVNICEDSEGFYIQSEDGRLAMEQLCPVGCCGSGLMPSYVSRQYLEVAGSRRSIFLDWDGKNVRILWDV